MDTKEAPHRPEFYVAGGWTGDEWVEAEEATAGEIFHFCEHYVHTTEEWDLCMKCVICIEEYAGWWERVRAETKDP